MCSVKYNSLTHRSTCCTDPRMWTAGCFIASREVGRGRLRGIESCLLTFYLSSLIKFRRRMEESPTKVRKRIQHEDISVGNNLQNRMWSNGNESEDDIASENALLNEVNEPRFVYKRANLSKLFADRRLCICIIIARTIPSNHIDIIKRVSLCDTLVCRYISLLRFDQVDSARSC